MTAFDGSVAAQDLADMVRLLGPEEVLGTLRIVELRSYCKQFGLAVTDARASKMELIDKLGSYLQTVQPGSAIAASPRKATAAASAPRKANTDTSASAASASWGARAARVNPVQGLQSFRAGGRFCDLVLVVGGHRFPAHQAVLASASSLLCKFLTNGVAQATGIEEAGVGTRPLMELELAGVSEPSAVEVMLDCVYGVDSSAGTWPQTLKANRDVLHLANAFELQSLLDLAMNWLTDTEGIDAAEMEERLAVCQELPMCELTPRPARTFAASTLKKSSTELSGMQRTQPAQAGLKRHILKRRTAVPLWLLAEAKAQGLRKAFLELAAKKEIKGKGCPKVKILKALKAARRGVHATPTPLRASTKTLVNRAKRTLLRA